MRVRQLSQSAVEHPVVPLEASQIGHFASASGKMRLRDFIASGRKFLVGLVLQLLFCEIYDRVLRNLFEDYPLLSAQIMDLQNDPGRMILLH